MAANCKEQPTRRKSSLGSIWKNSELFLISLLCPDNSSLFLIHNVRETCENVLNDACTRMGIEQPEFFGLATHKHNEFRFISLKKQLYKVFPKDSIVTNETVSSTEAEANHSDNTIRTCKMYLRIKFFTTRIDVLKERTTAMFYEQLRWDMIKLQNLLSLDGYSVVNTYFHLAFYALLASEGSCFPDFNDRNKLAYFLPQVILQKHDLDEIAKTLVKISGEVKDITSVSSAKRAYVYESSKLPLYGAYMHVVDLKFAAQNTLSNCWAAVNPNGISIYHEDQVWSLYESWSWAQVREINPMENRILVSKYGNPGSTDTISIETYDDDKATYVAKFCRQMQHFQIESISSLVKKIITQEQEKRRRSSLPEFGMRVHRHRRMSEGYCGSTSRTGSISEYAQ